MPASILYNGRSVEEALNELLYSKSKPQLYKPEPAPVSKTAEDILIEKLEKKVERLRYLMHRSRKRRKRIKLAKRILLLYERIDDMSGELMDVSGWFETDDFERSA